MLNKEKLYDYLKENHLGKENGIKLGILSYMISDSVSPINKREVRRVISELNSDLSMNGLVSTSGKIYLCNTKEECEKAVATAYRLAFSCLKKARKMEKKLGLNGQREYVDDEMKFKIIFNDGEDE